MWYRSLRHPLNGNRPAIGDPQLLRSRVGQHFPTSANIGGKDSQFLAKPFKPQSETPSIYNNRIRKYIHSFIYVRTHIYIYTWSLLTSTVSGLHRLHGAFKKNGATLLDLLASLLSPWRLSRTMMKKSGSHIFSEPICPISCCFRPWDSKLQHPGNRGFQKDHSTGQQDALGGEWFGSALLWGKIRGRKGRHPKKWEDWPRIHGDAISKTG